VFGFPERCLIGMVGMQCSSSGSQGWSRRRAVGWTMHEMFSAEFLLPPKLVAN
jgi:hypothetical protein